MNFGITGQGLKFSCSLMLCYLWCNFPHFHRCESLRLRFRHDGGRGAAKVCQFRGRKSPSAVGACFALNATIYQRLELSSSKRSQENGRYLPRRCSVKRIFVFAAVQRCTRILYIHRPFPCPGQPSMGANTGSIARQTRHDSDGNLLHISVDIMNRPWDEYVGVSRKARL